MPQGRAEGLVLVLLLALGARGGGAQGAFLEAALPLRVVATTPTELGVHRPGAPPVQLQGRQALTVRGAAARGAACAAGQGWSGTARAAPRTHARRAAAQAVFSRPVIALGSDFGSDSALPPSLVPFSLTCGSVPGRLRWVTTSIARWDPAIDWPTDLDCALAWNAALETFDGAPLVLGGAPAAVPLATAPLVVSLSGVASPAAAAATGDQWSATLGLPDDRLPEVPPDGACGAAPRGPAAGAGPAAAALRAHGSRALAVPPRAAHPHRTASANITLSFSYPVDLARLAAALKVAGPGGAGRAAAVSPCAPAPPSPPWAPTPAAAAAGDALALNSTCAVVRIMPGLAAGAAAALRLPAGARYSAVAGPVANDTDVAVRARRAARPRPRARAPCSPSAPGLGDRDRAPRRAAPRRAAQVFGLRAFRIPLSWDFTNITAPGQPVYNGARYNRLTLWLPHGLAPGVGPEAVRPLLSLCALGSPYFDGGACAPLAFELTRPTNGTLVLSAPALTPGRRYRLAVKADPAVKDAFGLPLQASANAWWTLDLEPAFGGPSLNQPVALLEANKPDSPALPWPWLSRGAGEPGLDRVQAWAIDAPPGGAAAGGPLARALAGATSYSGVAADAFGPATPVASLARPTTPAPSFQTLPLRGGRGLAWVGACCRNATWPAARRVFASNLIVAQSNLQVALVSAGGEVVAWVTTTQGASKPVAGARVQVFSSAYGQDSATPGAACTTDDDGTCALDLPPPPGGGYDGTSKSAVVTAEGHGPLVLPSVAISYVSRWPAHAAALVLDRAVVKPGDALHVTGFIQRRDGTALRVDRGLKSVVLQVNPGFGGADGDGGSTRVTAAVDASFGSVHAVIPVPRNATPAQYTLQLVVPAPGAAAPPPGGAAPDGVIPPAAPPPAPPAPEELAATVGFAVADPRPPTAALVLSAPPWARPAAAVPVTLAAESYLGTDVSGANVTLAWETRRARGSLVATTNASGVATAVVELGKLPAANASEPGDTLTLRATWIGPTREAIVQSKTVRIEDGPVRVQLARTLLTDVPGIRWGVRADAFSNDDDAPVLGARARAPWRMPARAAQRIPARAPPRRARRPRAAPARALAAARAGVDVDVTLSAANGSASLANCSAAARAALAAQRCVIRSGDAAGPGACQLALPCAGEFELRGCVAGSVAGSCGRPLRLGHNASWWAASPWSTPPRLNLLADRPNVTLGGEVALSVQNPWWGPTSGLLVWGNAAKRVVRQLPQIPPGASTVTVSGIGEECVGSCRFVLLLAVARAAPPAGASAAAQLGRFVGGAQAPDARPAGGGVRIRLALPRLGLGARFASAGGASGAALGDGAEGFALPDVPTSKLFDPLAPRTVSAELQLAGPPPPALAVGVAVAGQSKAADGTAVVEPKSGRAELSVRVRDAAGRPVAGAEVTLLVVDRAILDLVPYPLQNVSVALAPDLGASFSVTDVNDLRVTRAAINATFSALQRRLRLDAWLPADTGVSPASPYVPDDGDGGRWAGPAWPPSAAAADVPDASYLARFTTPLTPLPSRVCAPPPLPAAPPPRPRGAELRVSGDFKVTVLFRTLTAGADGVARTELAAPDNVGRFAVRAYVAAPAPGGGAGTVAAGGSELSYGAAEGALVVRRRVSLSPSLPRAVRVGDNFTAGVLVEAPGLERETTVSVAAALAAPPAGSDGGAPPPPLALAGPQRVSVVLRPGAAQAEARFAFAARALGTAAITFTAAAAGSDGAATADAVQLSVPVLGVQSPVWLATSFAVAGSNVTGAASRVEGLALPAAEAGSGAISLVAGVGYLPAVQGTYEALVRAGVSPYRGCPAATDAVALALLPSLLATYRPPGTPLASFLTASQLNVSAAAADAAAGPMTDAALGLMPGEPRCLYPAGPPPSRADVALNAWAAWLVAGAANASRSGAPPAGPLAALARAAPGWRAALAAQLVADAAAARRGAPPAPYADLETLSWARLALGAGWAPPGAAGAEVAADLGMPRLAAAAANLSVGGQARVGLALLAAGGAGAAQVGAITDRLLGAVRVGGRTAYIASGGGARGAAGACARAGADACGPRQPLRPAPNLLAPLSAPPRAAPRAGLADQALALELLLRSGAAQGGAAALVQKLAAWVAQGAAPPPMPFAALCPSSTAWDGALRAAALTAYDAAAGSATPDLGLTVFAAVPAAAPAGGARRFADGAGGVELLGARFNASNAGAVARSTTRWDRVPRGASLVFAARGRGEVSVAASLNFTPAALLPFPTYRGLWVQRAVQAAPGGGGDLAAAPLGAVLSGADETDLAAPAPPGGPFGGGGGVGVAAPRPAVALPLRGGAKPRGGARRRLASLPAVAVAGASGDFAGYAGPAWRWRPWPACPAVSTSPSVVTFTWAWFPAGTATVRFRAVAATSGTFVLPPAKASVRQQPEACPAGCSGSGACDLGSGACVCDAGFSGPDCSAFSSAG
ncbi:hypothetical protein HT031_003574 [Scenedesmus sp. PABB004]|nr:hypothetical protein HT031_003574 [Scenedesmus sp. PABB004]